MGDSDAAIVTIHLTVLIGTAGLQEVLPDHTKRPCGYAAFGSTFLM